MKYYLINNKIMKGSEMPENNFPKNKQGEFVYNELRYSWLSSLKPCEISESELDKIYEYLNIYSSDSNPIDVTNIIDENSKSGLINFYVEPKQVDGEIEAVEFAEWCDKQVTYIDENGNVDYKQLYEIFKNRK